MLGAWQCDCEPNPAAVFVLPLQLIDRTGSDRSRWHYPVAVFLPYVASLPAGVVLAIALPR